MTSGELRKAAEVYARTGNYSAAARAIGRNESAVRRALKRVGEPNRAEVHARACAKGLRAGRRYLTRALALANKLLTDEGKDGVGMEPRDVAAIMRALTASTDALLALDRHRGASQQARLTRQKTRLECEFLRARIDGALPPDRLEVESLSDEELDARIRALAEDLRLTNDRLAGEPAADQGAPRGAGTPPETKH